MNAENEVRRLDRRVVYSGRILTLEVDRVIEPGGIEVEREVVRHAGAAVILPMTAEDRLVLVRQYRYAVNDFLWEIPAGHIAPGESPDETARRELAEETGLHPARLEKLTAFFPSPGFSDEVMHLFLATDLQERSACPDEDESIEVGQFTLEEAATLLSQGDIRDGKTILGLMFMMERRHRQR
jgi:ADP-ribose pyrophosphatase